MCVRIYVQIGASRISISDRRYSNIRLHKRIVRFIDQRGEETRDGVCDISARQKIKCVQYCKIACAYYPLRVGNRISFSFDKYHPDHSVERGRSSTYIIFVDVDTKWLNDAVSH